MIGDDSMSTLKR